MCLPFKYFHSSFSVQVWFYCFLQTQLSSWWYNRSKREIESLFVTLNGEVFGRFSIVKEYCLAWHLFTFILTMGKILFVFFSLPFSFFMRHVTSQQDFHGGKTKNKRYSYFFPLTFTWTSWKKERTCWVFLLKWKKIFPGIALHIITYYTHTHDHHSILHFFV